MREGHARSFSREQKLASALKKSSTGSDVKVIGPAVEDEKKSKVIA